jgi:transposase
MMRERSLTVDHVTIFRWVQRWWCRGYAARPGLGPVVATAFASTLDEASRFPGTKHVRSYLGLVPREYSSGERQHRGRISKAGSVCARSLLVEAAWAVLLWKTERTRAAARVVGADRATTGESDGRGSAGAEAG